MPFMCDNCKWDYNHTCHDPRRPRVTFKTGCKDFEAKVVYPGGHRVQHVKPKQPWWRRLFGKTD